MSSKPLPTAEDAVPETSLNMNEIRNLSKVDFSKLLSGNRFRNTSLPAFNEEELLHVIRTVNLEPFRREKSDRM
jgi:hypothetical protein